jgi:serine/threonine-protein kinase
MTDYPALVGKIIADKYRVDRLLGQGGMGIVYLGQHVDLGRAVAVKLIRRELMETESVAERFMLEARSAAKIQSEHVGRVLDVGRLETGEPYIVMEYLQGQDLAAHLEQFGRFDYPAAVDLILEACEALAEAHHHQIVHRDLKPENLFLVDQPDGSFLVKVLDFGISKQLGAESSQRVLTSPMTALGSPQYMSPEQMEGTHVDVRSDIWALGAILYEMVTGNRTFDGDTLAQVCVQVLSGNVRPVHSQNPDVPLELAAAIEQCLRQQKEDRFANVAAFARAIEPFGTERARLSAQRASAVLGIVSLSGDRVSTPGAQRLLTPLDKTQPAPHLRATPGSRQVSAVSRTEVSTDGAVASTQHVTVNRSGARLPIFLGLIGVIVAGFGVWAFTRSQVGDARMHTTTPENAHSALGALAEPEQIVKAPAVTAIVTPAPASASEPASTVAIASTPSTASTLSAAPTSATNDTTTPAAAIKLPTPVTGETRSPKGTAGVKLSKPAVTPSGHDKAGSAKPASGGSDFGGRE